MVQQKAMQPDTPNRKAIRCGYVETATNITMELTAILHGLEFVRPAAGRRLCIVTDSEFSIKAVTHWWKVWQANGFRTAGGKPVANVDLIRRVRDAVTHHKQLGTAVSLNWTKGHAGHAQNEEADDLAGRARIERLTTWQETDAKLIFCAKCVAYHHPPNLCHDQPRVSSTPKGSVASYPLTQSARSLASRLKSKRSAG